MSAAVQRVSNLISLSTSHLALNPAVTASLLYILTSGPASLRTRLTSRIAPLRDPRRHATIIRALKWLLALGVVRSLNRSLNRLALNNYRLRPESARWNWEQEVAVVTGGSSGIGALIVQKLVNHGVKVAVLDIQELPTSLQGYANIHFHACDITSTAAVTSAATAIKQSLGRSPSILINNAGILDAHSILATTDAYLRKLFDVNVLSNWSTVRAFLPDMIALNKGHVVTVASAASYVGVAGMADYTASKAAVLAFHEGLNQELRLAYKAPGVLTTSVHPGWVRTPLLAPVEAELKKRGAVMSEPGDVADAVVKQVLSASGAQVFVPSSGGRISLLRALPNWVQESVRGRVSQTITESVNVGGM
ncbi:hypothetical protein EKO04_000218 [Ascochyta lentis]|uniref:Short-chain dehydrogenase/reductase 3 n=1 Tax=Ascochyta lentis TaxID=205686 RepID=A0A8H7JF73_9PLEO|nr:hypothetical protein EKO04_000218 [Ascochyta lentis]